MTALIPLTWHHFFRSFCGSADQTANAEGFARRLHDVAVEQSALPQMAVQALSLRDHGQVERPARRGADT